MRAAAQLACVVLIAALGRRLCTRVAESSCPHLDGCACKKVRRGLRVLCNATVNGDVLSADISTLRGLSLDSLILDRVNLTVIPSRYFENLTIKSLSVTNSPLQFTRNDSFEGAKILSTLHMGRNKLSAVPRGLEALPALKVLLLRGNCITAIENFPPLENLTELDLSRNCIESLRTNDLEGLGGLKKVWLGNNRIQYMSYSFFKYTKNIMFVDLHNNYLKTIYSVFQGRGHLMEIVLSNNNIIGIDRLCSGFTPKLKILRANNNGISWLSRVGPHNIAIEIIELRSCNISELRNETFSQLSELKMLDLSFNAIEYIPGNYFHKESKLKYFFIASNKLRSIRDTFKVTRRMEKLNLSMNLIEDIGDAFINMPALKILALRNNRIQFILDNTFKSNSNIEHLDLSGNKLEWLGKRLLSSSLSPQSAPYDRDITRVSQRVAPWPALLEVSLHS
ncbi:hypothetical protein MRX96_031131 [Rhipicephalus microplus]